MPNSDKPFRVLFMQSQTYYGADSRIHGMLMRSFDRSLVDVHVALNYGQGRQKSAAAQALEQIPDLQIRPVKFGPSLNERSGGQILRDAVVQGIPSALSLAALLFYIRKHNINIIHCTEKPRDAFYGYLLARLSGAKCVIHLHVKAEDWISKPVQWAMHRAHALIGVSEFVAGSIQEMTYPAQKIFYAHNSIDLREWDTQAQGDPIRQEFNLQPGTPLLLIASRLFSWKGHSELIEALALVKQRGQDFKLLVVGEDDPRAHPGGGSYLNELKTRVQAKGLSDHVIFTGFRSDTPRLFAACDIFTMPSFEEPFGVVYLEAMSMKKPIIALDNGGSREIVKHGVTGLLSAPKDIEHLAENILTLIQNVQMRQDMGECGRKKVEEYYHPDRLCSDILNIYQQVLDEQPLQDRLIHQNGRITHDTHIST